MLAECWCRGHGDEPHSSSPQGLQSHEQVTGVESGVSQCVPGEPKGQGQGSAPQQMGNIGEGTGSGGRSCHSQRLEK